MSDFLRPEFHDAEKAREWLEQKLWPNGPVCPRCGVINQATLLKGKSHRPGLYQCNACRKPFTVTVGTLYERSHVPLNKWLAATHLMMASKKGVSSLQIGRLLGLGKKTAWFLMHRIRESLPEDLPLKGGEPIGGKNKVVEIDETYVSDKAVNRKGKVPSKTPVLALVERDDKVRPHCVPNVTGKILRDVTVNQVDRVSYIMTDEAAVYTTIGREFGGHGTVKHSAEEYVCAFFWHADTVENYFSILKRGIIGVYHHTSQEHLHRYLAEFDFRYNNREGNGITDAERMGKSVQDIVGHRLTHRPTGRGANI